MSLEYEDYLKHYGVKSMLAGRRRGKKPSGGRKKSSTRSEKTREGSRTYKFTDRDKRNFKLMGAVGAHLHSAAYFKSPTYRNTVRRGEAAVGRFIANHARGYDKKVADVGIRVMMKAAQYATR